MGGLLSRQRRRVPRPSLVQGLALLHGRSLHLPPAALSARTYPAGHPIAAGLHPFRVRLHLQRATVTVVRALGLAALAAIAILLVRLAGIGMPPLVPLLGAGGVFVAALCTILWQRPSTPQMAHALDQRLGLHEQIGSALELEPSSSRLAALLYQRTIAALDSANPAYILPWPSLRRERISLIILGLMAGLCALLAAHAPPSRQFAAAPTARTAAARHSGLARHHARTLPVKLLALGAASARPANRGRAATPAAPAKHLAASQGGPSHGRVLPGSALSLHAGRGHGQGSPAGAPGSARHGSANPLAPNGSGRAAGRGSALQLASGKNSAAGGVASPQQQALTELQNSIASAQALQGQPIGSMTTGQDMRRNVEGQSQLNGSASRQGQGRGNAAARAARERRSSARGQLPGGAASRPGESSSRGRSSGMSQRPGYYGDASDPMNPEGRRGGRGTGPQSSSPTDNASATNRSAARLASNQGITLNGAPGTGGRLIVSQGGPTRAPGVKGSSLYGAPGSAAVTVPGYVAPDSNTVAPDERSLIRHYFSPSATG
jgi:hypothetical protein